MDIESSITDEATDNASFCSCSVSITAPHNKKWRTNRTAPFSHLPTSPHTMSVAARTVYAGSEREWRKRLLTAIPGAKV